MKKLVIGGLAVLLALSLGVIIACDGGIGGEVEYTNVIYSADGKNVTLLLEGAVPVDRAARALSSDIAKRGHDFYEVVFVGGGVTTRASWIIGESASISGVGRGPLLDYGDPDAAVAAVLFVGTMNGKTLLAVGKLVDADGTANATPGTIIDIDTTRVTFEVASLTGSSSTCTVSAGGTPPAATPVTINNVSYTPKPLAFGQANNTVTYPITITGTTPIADYGSAIRVVEYTAADIYNGIMPRAIQVPNGKGGSFTYQSTALTIGASMTANPPAIAAYPTFDPVIVFNLDTTAAVGANAGLVAVTFSIPVIAKTQALGLTDGPITWKIQPGIGSYNYYLDSGATSQGGALLFSVGDGPFDVIQIAVQ